jgi:hypothetical protein
LDGQRSFIDAKEIEGAPVEAKLGAKDAVDFTPSALNEQRVSEFTVPAIHVWATGQDDNIGDSLLRRGYLNALRQIGSLNVWTGPASPGFISGLGLAKEDGRNASFAAWYWSAMQKALVRRTFVAMNAGEVPVSRKGAARLTALGLLASVCRIRGGGGLWIGAGVPNTHPVLVLSYKAVAVASVFVRWRDHPSELHVAKRGTAPDWAFALGTPAANWALPAERDKLAIVLRGDRPIPSPEWLEWVRGLAVQHQLRPTVVVQVKRDNERALELANLLSADVVTWDHDDHEAQEAAARDVYAQTAVVIGDRLHGLIVAATEGAIPLGWVPSSSGKIQRHFHVVDLDWVGEHEGAPGSSLPALDLARISKLRAELTHSINAARKELDDTVAGLRQKTHRN